MQLLKPRLNFVITTVEPKNINRLLLSIQQKLSSFEISIAILLIGKATFQKINSFQFRIKVIKKINHYVSITETRNLCQQYLQKEMQARGGIGLILDDDLIWTSQEIVFLKLLEELNHKKCDMAFCALSGDPPIPKEYIRASPLLDLLLSIQKSNPYIPIAC